MEENRNEKFEIEGRNAVMEAFRSGKTVDKLYLQDGCHDGSINSIVREAKKQETIINYVSKEKLNQMSSTGKHQGVIAHVAAYEYSAIDEIFAKAEEKDSRHLSLFWMRLKIRIILAQSFVQRICAVHMALLFRNEEQSESQQQLLRLLPVQSHIHRWLR